MTHSAGNACSVRLREGEKIDGKTEARAAHYSTPRASDMAFNPGFGPKTILS